MEKTDGQPATEGAERTGNVVELPQRSSVHTGERVSDFIREHPLLVIAGGIAVGAVAAALLPKGSGRRLARRAIGLAELAGSAGALLGTQMREQAEAAGAGLREQGGAMAGRLEKLGESAAERWDGLSDATGARMERLVDPIEHAAGKVAKKAAELRSRARH